MMAQKEKQTVSLDASKRSADAVRLMHNFGSDIYQDHKDISKVLEDITGYFENGRYEDPRTGEHNRDFSENSMGLRNSLLYIRDKALTQFDTAQRTLEQSRRLSDMEKNELEKQKTALTQIADSASTTMELLDDVEKGNPLKAIPSKTDESTIPGMEHGFAQPSKELRGEEQIMRLQTPPVVAREQMAQIPYPDFEIDVYLPSETFMIVGGELDDAGTHPAGEGELSRNDILVSNLAGMLEASVIGTNKSRANAGKAFWNNIMRYVNNDEADAKRAVCGVSISSSACNRLVRDIKNGNYDQGSLTAGNTPLSEMTVNAADNLRETWTGTTFVITTEAQKIIKEWNKGRVKAGVKAGVVGTHTVETQREDGQVVSRTESDDVTVGMGANVSGEVDITGTGRSTLGLTTGVDAFQSTVGTSVGKDFKGKEWRFAIPTKVYFNFETGMTEETAVKGEIFGKIDYGKLSKEQYERLKMELGGALVFILFDTGTQDIGVVTTVDALQMKETEDGFEYMIRSVELGLGPEISTQLKKGSDARIMIVPKYNIKFEALGEGGEYKPLHGGSLDLAVTANGGKFTGSLSIGVSESYMNKYILEGDSKSPPVFNIAVKVTW
ncbi:MAG: hypothetical protein GY852_06730 [bacterium]|nr:hypothetical protein [bacterium]